MDRSIAAANWQERFVALALVVAVGLTTQFVVERTLPEPGSEGAALGMPGVGLGQAAREAPSRAHSLSGEAALGAGRGLESARPSALSALAGDEFSDDGASGSGEPREAPRLRTRTRRLLPTQRPELSPEVRSAPVQRVALALLPAGWTDLAAPLRAAGEPAVVVPAMLVPTTHAFLALVPATADALEVTLEIPAELEPEIAEDGCVLRLRDRAGNVVQELPVPRARDGRGRELQTRYEERDGVPRVRIDPRGALPPIEVRPGERRPESRAPEPRDRAPRARCGDAPAGERSVPSDVQEERAPASRS